MFAPSLLLIVALNHWFARLKTIPGVQNVLFATLAAVVGLIAGVAVTLGGVADSCMARGCFSRDCRGDRARLEGAVLSDYTGRRHGGGDLVPALKRLALIGGAKHHI